MLGQARSGPPVYAYDAAPGVPPVSVMRLALGSLGDVEPDHAHAHDFPLLSYFEHGGGSLRIGSRVWPIVDGDLYLVAPGEVVGAGDTRGFAGAAGWAIYFSPEVLGPQPLESFLGWRTHALLFPFARDGTVGIQHLAIPAAERAAWSARFAALDAELREQQPAYQEAVLARLTLLLVGVARLAAAVGGDRQFKDDPLLARVFGVIEARYGERISLHDVARAVSLSPGHLTTIVRRKTGRTVLAWIAERRLAEARRLLVETDLTVGEIGRRIGFGDAGHFVRAFRDAHHATPRAWRLAART